MAIEEYELATALLNWRSRVKGGMVRWEPDGEARKRFAEHLAATYRSRHLADLQQRVEMFAHDHPAFPDWIAAVLAPFREALVFTRGAPWIRPPFLTLWRHLTGRVDPDTLIAYQIASTCPGDVDAELARLDRWGYYIGLSDHGFDRVVEAGLADIHVHFEASDPMPLLWLRLASGRVGVHQLQFYSDRKLESLEEDPTEHDRRLKDRETLQEVPSLRRDLFRVSGIVPGCANFNQTLRQEIVEERRLLCRTWANILDQRDMLLAGRLDRYLFAKSLFLRRHQQRAGAGPGLDRFRDFLDRGRTLGDRRAKRERNIDRRQRYDRMLSLATEPEHLRTLELRIAPANSLQGWGALFRTWEQSWSRLDAKIRERINVSFVVHFIRNPEARGKRNLEVQFGDLRTTLDRQTALLHLFRHRCPNLAKYIVGIDVANLERGCPPEIFAPYLRLLRGYGLPDRARALPVFDRWRVLSDRRLLDEPASLPTLGLTYHVGEDFYHPIDGLRAISGLLRNVLNPGDRIGHGLAIGTDAAAFRLNRGFASMPRGLLLDDLVWLRRETSPHGQWTGALQMEGNHAIDDLCREIYGQEIAAGILERVLDTRFHAPLPAQASAWNSDGRGLSPEELIIASEAYDQHVREQRTGYASISQSRLLFLAETIVPDIQKRIARAIRDRGVAVEANPSSNLVTGAVDRLSDHPFFAYWAALNKQVIVSINTDDPGVFGTRTDIEYGLMFEAMLERGLDRQTSLEILEAARKVAFSYAFRTGETCGNERDTQRGMPF